MNNYDDYDFTPSSSSNLATLFDSSSVNPDTSKLIYTAPKQPKLAEASDAKTEPTPQSESSVICARVVQVWKLVDNKYIPMGKHGLAIIGSSTQNSYEMILYREKRNVIVRIKICQNFEISSKKDDFASFYDSLKENWLIKFGSSDDLKAVLNQIEMFGGKTVTADELNENVGHATQAAEHSENPQNKVKADILSRIAKMGQSILPNKNVDVDEQLEENATTVHASSSSDSQESRNFQAQQIIRTPITTSVMQFPNPPLQSVSNSFIVGQPMTYDPLNLYVAENRAQNSEMRINLLQLSDKVNQILKLVDHEKPTIDTNSDNLKSRIKVLDLRIENLTKEVQTYQRENAQLKQQLSDQDNVLRSEEQSKTELKRMKEEEAVKIANLEKQVNTYRDDIEDLEEKIQKQTTEIEKLESQLRTCDDSLELKNEILDLNQKLKEIENQEKSENLSMLSDENKKLMATFVSVLKSSMNEMYGSIISNLDEGKNYETTEISSIIAQNIKSTTLKIIHNFQEVYNKNSQT